MGWRDRDWAKFSDDEWRELYGVDRGWGGEGSGSHSIDWARVTGWTVVGFAALALLVVTVDLRRGPSASTPAPPASAAPRLAVLYGIRGSGANDLAPGGRRTACTEMAWHTSAAAWTCLSWNVNSDGVPVVEPRPFGGPCAHAVVDQQRGAWSCVSATPEPADRLPWPAWPGGGKGV